MEIVFSTISYQTHISMREGSPRDTDFLKEGLTWSDIVQKIMLLLWHPINNTYSLVTELLRRNAEQCLRDMTQLVFMRLPQFCDAAAEEGAVEGGALSLRRRANSARRGRARAQGKSTTFYMQWINN